jgi:hypothetical protein
VIASS